MKAALQKSMGLLVFAAFAVMFLLSRSASFFSGAWGISMPFFVWAIAYFFWLALTWIFKKPLLSFLEENAYWGNPKSFIAYVPALAFSFVCPGVISCKGVACLIGGGLLLGLFALLIFSSLKSIKGIKVERRDIIFTICAAAVLNVIGVLYCLNMKRIFVWDNAGYFLTVQRLDAIFPSAQYIKEVYRSVFETDYNYIIAIPSNIFCKIFGVSGLTFVLSIMNLYVLPLVLLVYKLCRSIWKTVFVFLALPYIIFAANTGFIDIGGVFFALLAAALFFKEKPVLSGVLLAFCVLLRRWYSFYALTFIITSLFWCISKRKIKDFVIQGCFFAFVLLFFAQDFVVTRLLADYSYAYSAYSLGIETDVKIFTRYFGILLPAFAVIYSLCKKSFLKELFMTIQGALCFVLFTALQTHGQQHLALYCPAFLIILLSALSKKKALVYLCICFSLQTASTFVPRVQPKAIGEIKAVSVLPTFTLLPPVDVDAESFLPVAEYVDEIGAKGKSVVFLASSLEMNYDTLRNVEISLSKKYNRERESYYLPISDVDKRDGLSPALFEADYVLVPSQLQIHLAESEQRVISVPYKYILSGENIGGAYQKQKKEFALASGIKIYVYERIRLIKTEEIVQLEAEIMGN